MTFLTPAEVARRLSVDGLTEIVPTTGSPGVYFLCDAELRCVYVGQSTNVYKRVWEHAAYGGFARAFFVPCAAEDLNLLEGHFIRTLKPLRNRYIPKPAPPEPMSWEAACEAVARMK